MEEIVLNAGGRLALQGFPNERLYYALDGRGIIRIYEAFPQGDVCKLRQDLAIYMTPQIKHEIVNAGDTSLRLVVFRIRAASGGSPPERLIASSAGNRPTEGGSTGICQAALGCRGAHSQFQEP
jgi:hypothetical protein